MKKRIAILGGGESGVGAAVLAQKQGYEVFVSDKGKIKDKYKEILNVKGISWEEEKHSEDLILNASEVIKSPGIPDKAELIKLIQKKGIPVISEIEFAARFTRAKMICITGSNGKTTTTMLTYHTLKKAGLSVGIGGNVGKSFALQVAENDFDHYVLELSSFQLDNMYKFKADIAVLLNITPDHLDRYEYELKNYIDSKFRVLQNMTVSDSFIYCKDDEITAKEVSSRDIATSKYAISIKEPVENGAFIENENLIINIKPNPKPFSMSIHELALQGKHNLYNSMAAGIVARLLDVRKDIIRESFSDFENVEHRLEFVAKVHGIEFINDSKATNVNSTWFALESMNNPVVWIVGGVDKGNNYEMLKELVKEKVKAIICLGTDNKKIIDAFKGSVVDISEAANAKDAVTQAYKFAKQGDTVLLSPACASFDMFENFEDRGSQFKKAVRSL